MKKYWIWGIVLLLQAALFWLLPLCAGPTDIMGMIVLMLCITPLLSAVLGVLINGPEKFLYPALVMLLFIPSVPVYYNMTAMIHAVWYLVLSAVGVGFGALVRLAVEKIATSRMVG